MTSVIMGRIRGKDTSIEMALRSALWGKGVRFRKNFRALPGTPDIAFTRYRLAVFCDSEFWHGKDWEALRPKLLKGTNPDFWIAKIERNRARDIAVDRELKALGWAVLRFWGKDIMADTEGCAMKILRRMKRIEDSKNRE